MGTYSIKALHCRQTLQMIRQAVITQRLLEKCMHNWIAKKYLLQPSSTKDSTDRLMNGFNTHIFFCTCQRGHKMLMEPTHCSHFIWPYLIYNDVPSAGLCIGGADVTVKKIPTTIKIISLKKIWFYSESNWFKLNHKIWFEFFDLKINLLI
jgi:hypothetical protein